MLETFFAKIVIARIFPSFFSPCKDYFKVFSVQSNLVSEAYCSEAGIIIIVP